MPPRETLPNTFTGWNADPQRENNPAHLLARTDVCQATLLSRRTGLVDRNAYCLLTRSASSALRIQHEFVIQRNRNWLHWEASLLSIDWKQIVSATFRQTRFYQVAQGQSEACRRAAEDAELNQLNAARGRKQGTAVRDARRQGSNECTERPEDAARS
ncbi:hypothetical protein K438DRAFT_1926685 [Mycena galopus ATCC 62051]|nr:hypothetical protein K438DRAFT_1926685 [Mycena galopus ATCC 62051]